MSFFNKKQASYVQGLLAEYFAILILWFKGYRILKHRYKTPLGEIDIVCFKKNYFIFVEVKKRQELDEALLALRPFQRQRLINAARFFLANQGIKGAFLRFDFFTFNRKGHFVHHKNVSIEGF